MGRRQKIPVETANASQALGTEAVKDDARPEPENGKHGADIPADEEASPEDIETASFSQCLTFYLAGEEFAVSVLQIKEIFEFDSLTRVPSTPTWIRGVMNLRGSVVPVVDLAVKFGFPETLTGKQTCVLIVEVELAGEKSVMGVMVDSVSRVTDWTPEEIEPAPAFGSQVRVDYLEGMGKLGQKFVPILDINRVLSADELLTAVAVPSIGDGNLGTEDSKADQCKRERLERAEQEANSCSAVDAGVKG